MFEYTQGYEIDGSDTSFNIVIPDRTKLHEIARYFLNLPIFDGKFSLELFADGMWAPHRDYHFEHMQNKEDILKEINMSSDINGFFIVAKCKHPDNLEKPLKDIMLEMSNDRVMRHNAVSDAKTDEEYHEYINPSIGYFYYTDLNVALLFFLKQSEKIGQYSEPFGFVLNKDLYNANSKNQNRLEMELTCGPSFIYEYAAYIVLHLAERFPELSVSGGLDCADGFVDGCTYSTNLYHYERFIFETDGSFDEFYSLFSNLLNKAVLPCKKVWTNSYSYHFKVNDKTFSLFHAAKEDAKSLDIETYYSKILNLMKSDFTEESKINQSVAACCVYEQNDSVNMWDRVSQLTVHTYKDKWLVELLVPSSYRKSVEMRIKSAGIQYK